MEVGLGIHGEPGAMVSELSGVDGIVDTCLAYITKEEEGWQYLSLAKGDRVALLVNNLGGSTNMELAVATRKAITLLESPTYGVIVERVYVRATPRPSHAPTYARKGTQHWRAHTACDSRLGAAFRWAGS